MNKAIPNKVYLLFLMGLAFSNFPTTKIQYVVSGDTLSQPYFRNFNIDSVNNNVKYAIVSLHGDGRNAQEHFNIITQAAENVGLEDSTILLAPVYPYFEDLYDYSLGDDVLYWSDIDWNAGDLSRNTQSNPRPFRISSFSTLDTIYHRLVNNNPNLKKITLTGHSAGSQMVVRYAAGGRAESAINNPEIDFFYVPTNTPSFLYYDDNRVLNQGAEVFQFGPTDCGSASQYKYGLENLNQYMTETGENQIVEKYKTTNLTYLVGQYDFGGQTSTCARMVQGNSRLLRTHVYFSYIGYFYGDTVYSTQKMVEIPSAYHEFEQIVFTECGINTLFGVGDCDLFVDGTQLFNHLPTAIAGEDQIVNPGTVAVLNASESFDQDGEIENYTWTQLSSVDINIEFPDSAYTSFIVPEQGGFVVIQLEVFDNDGATGRDTISYIINSPPDANAGEDQQVGASVVVLLDGSMSTDVNDNIGGYSWSQISGTAVSLFSNNQEVATFYSPLIAGELSFELSVVDEMGLEDKDTTNISIATLMTSEGQNNEKDKIQISPNPFNSSLLIGGISGEGFVVSEVAIYNIVGKKIISWKNLNKGEIKNNILWNGKNDNGFEIRSGLYFVRLISSKNSITRKVTYIK